MGCQGPSSAAAWQHGPIDKKYRGPDSWAGLSRCQTHDVVHWSCIKFLKLPNIETLIFVVPASNHFMFRRRSCNERMSFMMNNYYKT